MSVELPMVKPPEIPKPSQRMRELADRLGTEVQESGRYRVLSTRNLARRIVEGRSDVSPTGAVYFDCREVEVVTPSFFDELRKLWPHVQPIGMSEDVAITWEVVTDHA